MKKTIKTSLFFKKEHAVSEIVGTLILIVIAVSSFSAVSIIVLNPWSNLSSVENLPSVLLVGSIHNNDVLIEHYGGVSLNPNAKITITIDGTADTFRVEDFSYWSDLNGDGLWNVGERLVYPAGNIVGKQVSCVIIDIDKNTIIFDKILQNGVSVFSPYITVLPPDDVTEDSAVLKMYYNFFNQTCFSTGSLNFTYGVAGGPYSDTPSSNPLSMDGWYGFQLNALLSGTPYEYWAWMNCSNGTLFDGPLLFYTYQKTRGFWHFDETFGSPTAADSINPLSNGSVTGAVFIPSGKINGSLDFTGISNYVDVPHHPKFNLTNEITVETWLNVSRIGAQFPGNVSELSSKNITDVLGTVCLEPDLIHISGTLYAIAYRDNASTSLTTYRMDNNGVFFGTIATKVISVPHFYEPTIIHIHDSIYAIAYGASDDQTEAKSHIITLPIYGNGSIGEIIDIFDFPAYYGREPNFMNIAPGIYAVAIGGASFETYPTGYLVTISIDDAGDISSALIDTLKFPLSSSCSEPSIVHINGDLYSVTYNGYGATAGLGYVITMHILSNGSIVEPLEEIDQFGLPEDGLEPTMIPVTDDIYAISYGSDSNNLLRTGYIKTLSINSLGHVINDSLDILPFYTYLSPIDYNFETDILHVEDNLYAVSFTGGNNSNWKRGFLTTVSITNMGNISDAALFIYEFKGRAALGGSSALKLTSYVDRLIVVYGSINLTEQGFLSMEKIDLIGQEKSIIQKGNAYAIMVNYDLLTAWMRIGNATYTVSGTVPFDSWTRVDLTYGGGFLKLYINDVIQTSGSEPCSGQVQTNTDHLLFGGGLFGSLDEIKISRGLYVPS